MPGFMGSVPSILRYDTRILLWGGRKCDPILSCRWNGAKCLLRPLLFVVYEHRRLFPFPRGNWSIVEDSVPKGSSTNSPSPESKSKPPAAPLDRPSFTFIDHDDDLTSKRIKDVNARKAIRSHVMRDVRRRERLAGLKRTSRRESRAHPVPTDSQSKVTEEPEERSLVLRAHSQSPTSSSVVETEPGDDLICLKQRRGRPIRWSAGYPLSSHLNPNPGSLPTSWFFDPFCSLPGSFELPSMVAHLVYYCKYTVFSTEKDP